MTQRWMLNCISWIAVGMSACADQSNSENRSDEDKAKAKDWTEFDVTIRKGDYVFVGMEDTDPNRHVVDQGVEPKMEVTLPIRTDSDEMTLQLRINMAGAGTPDEPWLFQGNIHRGKPEENRAFHKASWKEPNSSKVSDGPTPTVEKLVPELKPVDDPGANIGMWKIPYVKVNGHSRNVVVAKSRTVDDLKKAIKIPKVYVFFRWEPFIELK